MQTRASEINKIRFHWALKFSSIPFDALRDFNSLSALLQGDKLSDAELDRMMKAKQRSRDMIPPLT